MTPSKLSSNQVRALGVLPLAFFIAQGIHYWQIDQLGHMLWMCNIGNLLLAVGMFLERKVLIRVAVIWAVPGVAVWFLYVVPTWRVLTSFGGAEVFAIISSSLAHLGGISVGLVVLRRIGMDARAWLFAFAWYFIVQLLSRLLTPAPLNVNVSHNIQSGWEQTFSSYFKFWLVLTALVGLCLWMLERLLRLMWPSPPATTVHSR